MTANEFAALLGAKSLRRGKWIARCPAHGDRHPSLSIAEGKKHPVIFKCMSAGCTQDEVLKAMGLTWKDLLGERPPMSREASKRLRDEQTLYALRDLKGALISPTGAYLAGEYWRLLAALHVIDKKIRIAENKLFPELKAIRERDAKTARFVKRWGLDKLWEVYFERNPI
jgi:hypothetical protein